MWEKTWYLYLIILVLLILSFFFSSSEVVYSSVNQLKLKKEVEETGSKRAKKALHHATNFSDTVSTVLFGNAFTNIAASSIAAVIGTQYGPNGEAIAALIIFLVMLIFVEITPKTLSLRYSYSLSKIYAPIQTFFYYAFFPVVWAVTKLVALVSKPLQKSKEEEEDRTEDELLMMVDAIQETGEIDEEKGVLLSSAIDFVDTVAFEVMTPRIDMIAYDIDGDIEEFMAKENTFIYARLPVYEDTIDNIIGILSTRKLLKAIYTKQTINREFVEKELMVKPLFIHRTMSVSSLLSLFKNEHRHLAIVVDEYGGTEGIITLEDVIEEIVGDIWDEEDVPDEEVEQLPGGGYLVDGNMNLEDFLDLINYRDDYETDYTSVGGFVVENLNHFPKIGDTFIFDGYEFEVMQADEFSAEKIKVMPVDDSDQQTNENGEKVDE